MAAVLSGAGPVGCLGTLRVTLLVRVVALAALAVRWITTSLMTLIARMWRGIWFLSETRGRLGHSARAGAATTTAETAYLAWIEVKAGFPVARRPADESLRWHQSHVHGLGRDAPGGRRIDLFGRRDGLHHHFPDRRARRRLVGQSAGG
jgi:hypothetical protein